MDNTASPTGTGEGKPRVTLPCTASNVVDVELSAVLLKRTLLDWISNSTAFTDIVEDAWVNFKEISTLPEYLKVVGLG